MKPKFLEVIKLGTLVAVVSTAAVVLVTAYPQIDSTVNSAVGVRWSADGQLQSIVLTEDGVSVTNVGGAFGWMVWFAKLMFYSIVALIVGCAAWFFLSAFKVFADVFAMISSGIVSVVSGIRGPRSQSLLNEQFSVSSSGKVVTVADELILLHKSVASLKAKTDHIQPPPPPKTPEQLKEEQILELQAKLARFQEAENRKTIEREVPPAAVPAAEAK